MAAFSTPILTVYHQGQVASGAKVHTFIAGSTTLMTTYADAALTTPNSNPITADANGQVTLYIPTVAAMKIVLETATGEYIDTIPVVYPTANFTSGIGGEATLPSAAETDLGSTGANLVKITGTTAITSFGSSASVGNPIYYLRFADTVLLTYNATSLILPGSADITTSAGANAIFEYLGDGKWVCLFYQTATGAPLQAPAEVLLQTQVVVSPVASVDFTSGIDGTYSTYIIRATNVRASSGSFPNIKGRFRRSGSFLTTSDYSTLGRYRVLTGDADTKYSSIGADNMDLGLGINVDQNQPLNGELVLSNVSLSVQPSIKAKFSGAYPPTNMGFSESLGAYGVAGTIDGLRLFLSNGNFAAGTFKLYGVA